MKVIGIKFKDGGKIYYFAPQKNVTYEENMDVVVETAKSIEIAKVAFLPHDVPDETVTQPLKPVIRVATEKDLAQRKKNLERKPEAMRIAAEKIEKHGLKMKLIDCEFAFDGSKVVFYFAADGRVDFRELVKDLAGAFHIRIELRQVGIRDETKLLGGIAPCGLSLNPGKISGLCGRLMCCLSYENDYYSEIYKKMPKMGAEVGTPDGKGTVVGENMLKQTVRVKIEKDGSLVYKDFPLKDVRFKSDDKVGDELKDILD